MYTYKYYASAREPIDTGPACARYIVFATSKLCAFACVRRGRGRVQNVVLRAAAAAAGRVFRPRAPRKHVADVARNGHARRG